MESSSDFGNWDCIGESVIPRKGVAMPSVRLKLAIASDGVEPGVITRGRSGGYSKLANAGDGLRRYQVI